LIILTNTTGLVGLYVPVLFILDARVEYRVISRLELIDIVVGDLVISELLESRSVVE
jgi:hypothetical protein